MMIHYVQKTCEVDENYIEGEKEPMFVTFVGCRNRMHQNQSGKHYTNQAPIPWIMKRIQKLTQQW